MVTSRRVFSLCLTIGLLLGVASAIGIQSSQLWKVPKYNSEIEYTHMDIQGDELVISGFVNPDHVSGTYGNWNNNGFSAHTTYMPVPVDSYQQLKIKSHFLPASPGRIYSVFTSQSTTNEYVNTEFYLTSMNTDGSDVKYTEMISATQSQDLQGLPVVYLDGHIVVYYNDYFYHKGSRVVVFDAELNPVTYLLANTEVKVQQLGAIDATRFAVTGYTSSNGAYVAIMDINGNVLVEKTITLPGMQIYQMVGIHYTPEAIIAVINNNNYAFLVLDPETLEPRFAQQSSNISFGSMEVLTLQNGTILFSTKENLGYTSIWEFTGTAFVPYAKLTGKLFDGEFTYSVSALKAVDNMLVTVGYAITNFETNMGGGTGFVILDTEAEDSESVFSTPEEFSYAKAPTASSPGSVTWTVETAESVSFRVSQGTSSDMMRIGCSGFNADCNNTSNVDLGFLA